MFQKKPGQVVEEISQVCDHLLGLATQYQHELSGIGGAGSEYLTQISAAVQEINNHNLQECDLHDEGRFNAWHKYYLKLMGALTGPKLSLEWQGSPAYHLRQSYSCFAKLVHRLVELRSQLASGFDQNRDNDSDAYYPAPQSRLTWSLWWTWLGRRVFLPFLLIWDAICWLGNRILGRFFMEKIIAPALDISDWRNYFPDIKGVTNLDEHFYQGLPEDIITRRYNIVDNSSSVVCVECWSRDLYQDKRGDDLASSYDDDGIKTVVYFLGNLNSYQYSLESVIADMACLAQANVRARFLLWNYPGFYNSFGVVRKPSDFVRSGLFIVQHLLDRGVLPENMILKGHSLGGYVATHIAYCCHQMKLWVNLWSDRSFSDAPNYLFAKAVTKYDSVLSTINSVSIYRQHLHTMSR